MLPCLTEMTTSAAGTVASVPQDADMQVLNTMTSELVKAGLMAPEHQSKIMQAASAATAKVDELRSFLDQQFTEERALLLGLPSSQKQPARQQLLDSVSNTVLNINRIQSTFSLLSDAGQDVAQKIISFILGKLMAVLDDFKKHVQYQNWGVSFTGSVPPSLQVGVQITFQ